MKILLILYMLFNEEKGYVLMSAKNSSDKSVKSGVIEQQYDNMDSCYEESVKRNQAGARYFWCQKEE